MIADLAGLTDASACKVRQTDGGAVVHPDAKSVTHRSASDQATRRGARALVGATPVARNPRRGTSVVGPPQWTGRRQRPRKTRGGQMPRVLTGRSRRTVVAKKIAVSALSPIIGTMYPPPYDEPCLARSRTKLGDAAGLTQFGVNLLRLPPGAWPSQRHRHTPPPELCSPP